MRLTFRAGIPIRDAGEFKENEHPRAKNGQFTSGGGVVGSKIANNVTAPKKGTLSHSIWSAGAKMLEDGKVPNKTSVMEALAAQGVTANASTVGTQLAHLKKFLQGGKPSENPPVATEQKAPPKPKPKLPDTLAEFVNQVLEHSPDMKLEGTYGGKTYYKNSSGEKLSYAPFSNTWMHKGTAGDITTGTGMTELNEFLGEGIVPAKQPNLEEAPKKKPQPPKPEIDNSTHSAPAYGVQAIPKEAFKQTSKGVSTEEGLPAGVQESIKRYRGSHYTAINNAMRFTTDFENVKPAVMRDVLNLERSFRMVPKTDKELNLSRKVHLDALKTMAKNAGLSSLDDIQVGNVFEEAGVCSTAHNHNVWSGSVKFNITLPAGSRAIDLSETINKAESEVMLPPGTKFKITGKHPGKDGFLHWFDVEAIT
jgi:hypothetical protein